MRGCACAFKSCIRTCSSFNDITIFNIHNKEEYVEFNNTHYQELVEEPCGKYFEALNDNDTWHFLAVSFSDLEIKN